MITLFVTVRIVGGPTIKRKFAQAVEVFMTRRLRVPTKYQQKKIEEREENAEQTAFLENVYSPETIRISNALLLAQNRLRQIDDWRESQIARAEQYLKAGGK